MDKTKDDAFRNFLEKIQGQNKAGLLINTLQLKYERETAGEDADKDTDLWLNVFDKSFKHPEILIDDHFNNDSGPYGNCGKSCCSAVEQNW